MLSFSAPHPPPVSVRRSQDLIVLDNRRIRLTIYKRTGSYDIAWPGHASITSCNAEARFTDGKTRRTGDYPSHVIGPEDLQPVTDSFGAGIRIVVHHRGPAGPELRSVFLVYAGRPELIVRLDAAGSGVIGSNYLAPISTGSPVRFTRSGPLQSLFVPYDNDSYARFSSDGWGGAGSHEVGALYDDGSRHGLIVGSLDHDLWKSAVRFTRGGEGEAAGLTAYAGATSKYTHDTQPPGTVSGLEVRSPRMVIGWYDDWRRGLERYGDLNAIVKPPLAWDGPAPVGWSSWSGHKNKLSAADARAATDFIQNDIPWFRSNGTAYMNLDSFWDNLSRDQIQRFVEHAHSAGLRAGIYWTPFTAWGRLSDKVNGTGYVYRDLALKDSGGNPLPKLDGGYPLDPTHPGTLARIDLQLADFVAQGFDLVKLDFMTHGALEGQHADPGITTGTAAYAVGLKRIVHDLSPRKVGRPFFICLSIAPMFPQGFGHSRRISCDVFANIGATEYLLNSATYGWWLNNRLYRFNDPDSACVYRPLGEPAVSKEESRSRFTASAIAGGMMIEGDDLTSPPARTRVRKIYSNREILDLARRSLEFRPVDGHSGDKAGDAFVWVGRDGREAYVAAFNFGRTRGMRTLSLSRLGISDRGSWRVHDLWTGRNYRVSGALRLVLGPTDCALVRLTRL